MHSNESVEDYLETILLLGQKSDHVRSIDISNEMGYKKSSISVAMKNLREKHYIVMDENGYITLTSSGNTVASEVLDRHNTITNWLTSLGVPSDIASEDACRIEHVISSESFAAIKHAAKVSC